MSAPTPWSIKGISPEARNTAKAAAQREGLTLGAWITKRVIEAENDDASEEGGGKTPSSEKSSSRAVAPSTTEPRDDGRMATALDAVATALQRLDSRLDTLSDRVDSVSADVGRVNKAVDETGVRVEIAERAAALIADTMDKRQAALEAEVTPRPSADDLENIVRQAVAPLGRRMEALAKSSVEVSSSTGRAIDALAARVDEAALRHEEMSTAVGGAVASLAERLEDVEAALSDGRSALTSAAPPSHPTYTSDVDDGADQAGDDETISREEAVTAREIGDEQPDAAPRLSEQTLRAFKSRRASSDDAADDEDDGNVFDAPTQTNEIYLSAQEDSEEPENFEGHALAEEELTQKGAYREEKPLDGQEEPEPDVDDYLEARHAHAPKDAQGNVDSVDADDEELTDAASDGHQSPTPPREMAKETRDEAQTATGRDVKKKPDIEAKVQRSDMPIGIAPQATGVVVEDSDTFLYSSLFQARENVVRRQAPAPTPQRRPSPSSTQETKHDDIELSSAAPKVADIEDTSSQNKTDVSAENETREDAATPNIAALRQRLNSGDASPEEATGRGVDLKSSLSSLRRMLPGARRGDADELSVKAGSSREADAPIAQSAEDGKSTPVPSSNEAAHTQSAPVETASSNASEREATNDGVIISSPPSLNLAASLELQPDILTGLASEAGRARAADQNEEETALDERPAEQTLSARKSTAEERRRELARKEELARKAALFRAKPQQQEKKSEDDFAVDDFELMTDGAAALKSTPKRAIENELDAAFEAAQRATETKPVSAERDGEQQPASRDGGASPDNTQGNERSPERAIAARPLAPKSDTASRSGPFSAERAKARLEARKDTDGASTAEPSARAVSAPSATNEARDPQKTREPLSAGGGRRPASDGTSKRAAPIDPIDEMGLWTEADEAPAAKTSWKGGFRTLLFLGTAALALSYVVTRMVHSLG